MSDDGFLFSYDPKRSYILEMEEKKKSEQQQNADYDPYNYRVVEHPTT